MRLSKKPNFCVVAEISIYTHLKLDMLKYAEYFLCGKVNNGKRYVQACINDFDTEFKAIEESLGYTKEINFDSYIQLICKI